MSIYQFMNSFLLFGFIGEAYQCAPASSVTVSRCANGRALTDDWPLSVASPRLNVLIV